MNLEYKAPPEIKQEKIEKEIREKLKLYHQTTKEKWDKIQKTGSIFSERELLAKGLITNEQLNDFETTSTGDWDRMHNRDNFVYASTSPANFGEVTLEIDLDALNIPGAKVSTAGDFAMHSDEEDEDYFKKSEIPASEFISYLTNFLPTLPSTDWFWKGKQLKEISDFIGEAMLDKIQKNDRTKFRLFWKLYPEIIFPKELPLRYIKNVTIEDNEEKAVL